VVTVSIDKHHPGQNGDAQRMAAAAGAVTPEWLNGKNYFCQLALHLISHSHFHL